MRQTAAGKKALWRRRGYQKITGYFRSGCEIMPRMYRIRMKGVMRDVFTRLKASWFSQRPVCVAT